ncbi:hypothetical protein CYLTODRAFT_495524, partial [Cylindrobasidium torrendii FP15055 ss-10]
MSAAAIESSKAVDEAEEPGPEVRIEETEEKGICFIEEVDSDLEVRMEEAEPADVDDEEEIWWTFLQMETDGEDVSRPEKADELASSAEASEPLFTERKPRTSQQDIQQQQHDTRTEDKRRPAFRFGTKLDDPDAIPRTYEAILDAPITLPVRDLYA